MLITHNFLNTQQKRHFHHSYSYRWKSLIRTMPRVYFLLYKDIKKEIPGTSSRNTVGQYSERKKYVYVDFGYDSTQWQRRYKRSLYCETFTTELFPDTKGEIRREFHPTFAELFTLRMYNLIFF